LILSKLASQASEILVSETVKSYLDLREEARQLSQFLFADRFSGAPHGEAIEAALSIHLSGRGAKAFDPPFWYVSTSNFEAYQVAPEPNERFAVRLDSFATFREVELWKYAIARVEEDMGHSLADEEAYFAPGFLPWTDTSVIAIALLKQAIRAGAPG
jgi:hypothetical protein